MHGILLSCLGATHKCYFELLDKLQKRICRTVGRSLAAFLELLAHCENLVSLSLACRYYFGRCSVNWLNRFNFLILEGGLLVILIFMIFMILLLPFIDVKKMLHLCQ